MIAEGRSYNLAMLIRFRKEYVKKETFNVMGGVSCIKYL